MPTRYTVHFQPLPTPDMIVIGEPHWLLIVDPAVSAQTVCNTLHLVCLEESNAPAPPMTLTG